MNGLASAAALYPDFIMQRGLLYVNVLTHSSPGLSASFTH
jgi:hypothetical protein